MALLDLGLRTEDLEARYPRTEGGQRGGRPKDRRLMKSLRSQRQRGQQKKQLMFFHRPIMLSPSPAKASLGSMQPLLQSFPTPMIAKRLSAANSFCLDAAASPRPAGQQDGLGNFFLAVAAERAFPAAVAELGH